MNPLAGIKLKLNRAKTIINDLDKGIVEFAHSEPYTVSVYKQPDEGGGICSTMTAHRNPAVGPFNPNLVLLSGEALYQMRSCLDHLVHQLVLSNNPSFDIQKSRRHQFPICDTRQGYMSSSGRMINGASQLVRTLIEGEQPYTYRPNAPHDDPLWCLSELNNTDKHRLIPTTIVRLDTATAQTSTFPGDLFHIHGPVRLQDNEVFFSYRHDGSYDQIEAKAHCSVAFDQFPMIDGTALGMDGLLWRMFVRVSELIGKLGRHV